MSPLFFTSPILYFTNYLLVFGIIWGQWRHPILQAAPKTHRTLPCPGGSKDTAPPSPGSIPATPRLPGSLPFSFVPVPRLPRTLSESPLMAPHSPHSTQQARSCRLAAGGRRVPRVCCAFPGPGPVCRAVGLRRCPGLSGADGRGRRRRLRGALRNKSQRAPLYSPPWPRGVGASPLTMTPL